jgi:hypothetical protein
MFLRGCLARMRGSSLLRILAAYYFFSVVVPPHLVNTTLLVSIRSALQANWQKSIFSSQCKSHALVGCLEQNLLLRN